MNTNRVIAVAALCIALGLYVLGYFVDNEEAYLFPRLISIGMAVFAVALLVGSFSPATVVESVAPVPWLTIVPALAVFLAYVSLAEEVGFYATAFCAFFVLISIYAPERGSVRGWLNRFAVTCLFIGAMYCVFALLLKVQTPQGFLV